jgi:hypothetical protein
VVALMLESEWQVGQLCRIMIAFGESPSASITRLECQRASLYSNCLKFVEVIVVASAGSKNGVIQPLGRVYHTVRCIGGVEPLPTGQARGQM